MVEAGHLQEEANLAETAGVLVVEDQKPGQDEATKQGKTDRAAEEGDEFGVKPFGNRLSEPVAESGAWDAVLTGVLTLGDGRIARVGEGGVGLGGVDGVPVAGALPGIDGRSTVAVSHGSFPWASMAGVSAGRAVAGKRGARESFPPVGVTQPLPAT